jgi:nitrite reductase (NO-forming)
VLLVAVENVVQIAPDNDLYPGGLTYDAMTFNGTIPGPAIYAEKGEVLNVTLRNDGDIIHSLNFHAAFGPSHALSGVVEPGGSRSWTMSLDHSGAFVYHCDGDNLNGMWEHIASGMYGGIVVRDPGESPAASEFYVVFGEVYGTTSHPPLAPGAPAGGAPSSFDIDKFLARQPDLVLTNGLAFRHIPYVGTQARIVLNSDAEVFHVKAGDLTRWYLFNAGPRNPVAFNFGAGLVQAVAKDSSEASLYEVLNIPPGSGAVVEATFPEPGTYFGNDHDVASLLYGSGFVVIAE